MTNADIEKLFYPERKISLVERNPIIVIQSHMPEEHKKHLNYNEANFIEWENSVGEKTS